MTFLWKRAKSETVVMVLWLFWLLLMSLFGDQIPTINRIQPGRFIFPFWLLIFMLASYCWVEIFESNRFFPLLCEGMLFVAGAFLLVSLWVPLPGLFWPRLSNRLPRYQIGFIDFIKEKGPFEGRVLLECIEAGEPHFAELAQMLTHQLMLGGPIPGEAQATRFTTFATTRVYGNEPIIFGRYLKDFSVKELREYLNLYNISTISIQSGAAEKAIRKFRELLLPQSSPPGFLVYKTTVNPDWFIKGTAKKVIIDFDQIVIEKPSVGPLIIKWHWFPTLTTIPPMEIGAVRLLNDPVPFIYLVNKTEKERIVIHNEGIK